MLDVIEVHFYSKAVTVICRDKTPAEAEAVIKMAVARRGCDVSMFVSSPAGLYTDNEIYRGPH